MDSEITQLNYTVFRKDRDRHGGGVMVLVKTSIHAVRREDIENDSELLWVSVNLQSSAFLLGVFYRPPRCSDHTNLLLMFLHRPISFYVGILMPLILIGILLFLYHLDYQPSVTLCDLINDFGLIQLVQDPIRVDNILDILRYNKKHSTWLSKESLRLVRKKKRAYTKTRRTSLEADLKRYRRISNHLRN